MLIILLLFSLRYKFAKWPWSLPAQCLLQITCHPDTCCFWQLETRKTLLIIIVIIKSSNLPILVVKYCPRVGRIFLKIKMSCVCVGGRRCLQKPRGRWGALSPRAQRRRDQSQCLPFLTWWRMCRTRWNSLCSPFQTMWLQSPSVS